MLNFSRVRISLLSLLCHSILICAVLAEDNQIDEPDIPKPTVVQLAWQEAELGVLISYELHTFNEGRYVQSKARINPIKDVGQFNPVRLNTDQWVRTAKEMGARFAILTASHESGFRLWQSDVNPYSLKSVRWGDGKRDIVREFIDSCKKYSVKPGIYMGTRWNAQLGVYDFKVTERSTITQEEYNTLIEKEVEEICSQYGDLFELWFDGGAYGPKAGGPDVLSVFKKYQPNCLFYHNYQRADARWGGSESGTVPYPCWATMPFADGYEGHKKESHANGFRLLKRGDPEGRYWCPAMSDAPLRSHEWFWNEGDAHKVKPLKALVKMYYNSVGRNSTLILGLTPDTRGLIPDADAKRCREFGRAVREIFSNPIADTSGRGNTLELRLPANLSFDHIIIQEDIRHGERICRFKLECFSDGKWAELNTGSCIGHKRIIKIKPVTADKLRLTAGESIAEPIVKKFAVYNSLKPKTDEQLKVSGAIDSSVRTTTSATPFADRLEYVGIVIREEGWHIWGSSPIIGNDGKVHIFAAQWPNKGPFDRGWRHDSQIAHYISDSPEGPFKFYDVTLKGTEEETWDRYAPSNPLIKKIDGKYVLLYIANPIGVTKGMGAHPPTQRIGMATSKSLNGPWQRVGNDGLILSPSDDPTHWTHKASNGVVNPAFLRHPDGRFFLYYKSNKARMGLAIAEKLKGPYIHQPNPVTSNKVGIEDGYAFIMDGNICLLTTDNHGIMKRGGGLLWTSKDGLKFDPEPKPGFGIMRDHIPAERFTKPRTHYGRGGKFERPQVLLIDSKPAYLYLPAGTSIEGDTGTVTYVLRVKANY